MNVRMAKILLVLLVSLAVLGWLRADGSYDFDIRSIIPFMRGSEVGLHDWGGLILIGLGVWGLGRLCGPPKEDDSSTTFGDEHEEEDDVDADA